MNVNEAIAAVKSNPPSKITRTPWGLVHCIVVDADGLTVCEASFSDAAHIAAAVNAAPVLIAEVERLQKLLDAVASDAAAWPHIAHGRIREGVVGVTYVNGLPQCPAIYDRKPCECGADAANQARGRVRAALGVRNV